MVILFKSKVEADKVFHTYDEKRIYNMEGVATAPLLNNRMSMVSGVSGLSRMTDLTTGTAPDTKVNWDVLIPGIPKIQQIQVPARSNSALSNVTDVTVNENKITILRSHHLIAVSCYTDAVFRISGTFINHELHIIPKLRNSVIFLRFKLETT